MNVVVLISQATYNRLQTIAVPLEDTIDTVINRALNAYSKHKRVLIQRHEFDRRTAFDNAIINALIDCPDGKDNVKSLFERIHVDIADYLSVSDYKRMRGNVRWRAALHGCRERLVKRGVMLVESPKNTWQLAEWVYKGKKGKFK